MTDHKELKVLLAFVLILPLVAVAIWLPQSSVDLSPETVPALRGLFLSIGALFTIAKLVEWRLRADRSGIARKLKYAAASFCYLCYAAVALTACNFFMLSGAYLGANLALPLYDAPLAQISQIVGFDWISVVGWLNKFPVMSESLRWAYWSTLFQTPVLVFVLAIQHHKDRLLEYVALYSLTGFVTILFAIFMPALGAYPYYMPDFSIYSNFGAGAGIFHMPEVEALRNGEVVLINFADPKGIVTFPSFHTILAIIATYSARNLRYVFVPLVLLNVWVVVSTIPVGGHFLFDLPAGAFLAFSAIWLTKKMMSQKIVQAGDQAFDYPTEIPQRA